jgi:biopolymer transport protein ExbB/TolQ
VAVTLLLLLAVGGLVAILLLHWETVSVATVRETAQHWWRGLASTTK